MGIVQRIINLFRAKANNLIDRVEDPIATLNLNEKDLTGNLVKLRQATAAAIASDNEIQQQLNAAKTQFDQWTNNAKLALAHGDEKLAMAALARRNELDMVSGLDLLQAQAQESEALVQRLRAKLAEAERQIRTSQNKAELLKSKALAAQATQEINNVLGVGGSLERAERQVSRMVGQAEAHLALNRDPLEQQFAALKATSSTDAELAALKAELGASSSFPTLNDSLELQLKRLEASQSNVVQIHSEVRVRRS